MKYAFLAAVLAAATPAMAGQWNGKIIEVATGLELDWAQYVARLATADLVVLGEKHNTAEVQNAQAHTIRDTVAATRARPFAVNWEFLDFTAQDQIKDAFTRFSSGQIDGKGFLQETQGSVTNATYIPILEATRDLGGELHGVNISRQDKAPVVAGGIAAADPNLVPPGYQIGDADYYDRFVTTMQGHATADQMKNYFDAQCLTDDVIAYHVLRDSTAPLKFLVEGSFHTDYYDGTIARLKARGARGLALVRFVDASDYAESELPGLIKDAKYGAIADYVYFVKEPSAAR